MLNFISGYQNVLSWQDLGTTWPPTATIMSRKNNPNAMVPIR